MLLDFLLILFILAILVFFSRRLLMQYQIIFWFIIAIVIIPFSNCFAPLETFCEPFHRNFIYSKQKLQFTHIFPLAIDFIFLMRSFIMAIINFMRAAFNQNKENTSYFHNYFHYQNFNYSNFAQYFIIFACYLFELSQMMAIIKGRFQMLMYLEKEEADYSLLDKHFIIVMLIFRVSCFLQTKK